MSTPRFDLVDVTQTLRNRRRMLTIIMVITAALGAAVFFVRKKKYKAEAEVIISNPLYADRNNIFRTTDMNFVDYFGGEDDVDHVLAIAMSDTVRGIVARRLKLDEAYKIDLTNPEDQEKLKGVFKKRYEIKRTENTTARVSFVDTDPVRTAAVVNESIKATEEVFRRYYLKLKQDVAASVERKIADLDSSIVALTDTLGHLREEYKIYDIVNPARNTITGSIKSNGKQGFGLALERIQNIEAVKDQLVQDKAKNISILNEFHTGADMRSMEYMHVLTPAKPPVDPAGLGLILTVIASALFGFFFGSVYILITTYYKMLISVER